jgi:hypothetical protein
MLRKKMHIARSLVITSLAVTLSGPALANSGAPPASPVNTQPAVLGGRPSARVAAPMTPQATNAGEAQRYASREGSAKALETFRGGDGGIYIGGGVLVVALLVVLLVVLL